MTLPILSRLSRRNRNPIRVSDEIPIAESIRQMAENLNNFENNSLMMLRSLPSGTVMMGIATEEIQIGDFVTFDPDENGCPRVRKITIEESESITNPHSIALVERVARARRHATTEEAIEFIIDEHCQYVSSFNPTMFPGLPAFQEGGVIHPSNQNHEQDEKYPHICYKCKKKLKFTEAWTEVKKTGMTEEKFISLWEIEEIEFYCCSCYDNATRPRSHVMAGRPILGDAFDSIALMRNALNTANRRGWTVLPRSAIESIEIIPITPTVLFPDALHTLQSVARHRFGSPPVFTREHVGELISGCSLQQFHIDIRIMGNRDMRIYYEHDIVITVEDHERLRGIGPLDLSITAPNINSIEVARLVAELVFHWISAKVILRPENEEWISLNDRTDEILPSINHFIERMTNVPRLQGERAWSQFNEIFPNFPHMWNHNNESCDFCGLSPREVYEWSPRRMAGQIADYRERVLWRGAEIEQHPDSHIISGAEQNELSYREWLGHYLQPQPPAINRVNVFGGLVDGERLEAVAENPNNQQQNGVVAFVDHHPEITSRDELETLANSILRERESPFRNAPVAFSRNYELSMSELDGDPGAPLTPQLRELTEFMENELSATLGIHRDDLFGPHEHVWDRNLHCRVCNRPMVDIDAERNRSGIRR